MKRARLEDIEPIRFNEFISNNGIVLDDRLTRAQLNALNDIAYELEERERQYGILYYKPQWYQEPFHKSNKRIRMVLGGNQTGKTESNCAEIIRACLWIDPYKKYEKQWGRIPLRCRMLGKDIAKGVNEVLVYKLKKLIPPSEIKKLHTYHKGYWQKIEFKNGSTIEFMSYKQDLEDHESWTGHIVAMDEPPPQEIYTTSLRAVGVNEGFLWITATPLSEPWIYDEIYMKSLRGDSKIDVFIFSIYDNVYFPASSRDDFISRIPDDEREARVYGRFKHLIGTVYKEFGEVHLKESFEVPKNWTRICAMDYHNRKDCAIVWVAIDEKDRAWVYDELSTGGTIREVSEKIIAKEQEHGTPPYYRFIDSLSATPDRISGSSPKREFAIVGKELRHDLFFLNASKSWALGKNAISSYLKIINGEPNIYFFKDKCPQLIESLMKYTWDSANSKEGLSEKPRKIYDDFPDALRYALVLKPTYRKPELRQPFVDMEGYTSDVTGYRLGEIHY